MVPGARVEWSPSYATGCRRVGHHVGYGAAVVHARAVLHAHSESVPRVVHIFIQPNRGESVGRSMLFKTLFLQPPSLALPSSSPLSSLPSASAAVTVADGYHHPSTTTTITPPPLVHLLTHIYLNFLPLASTITSITHEPPLHARTAPHRTAPHRTAPHRTAPHRTPPSQGDGILPRVGR
jgi:hypothetical protein